LGRIRTDRRLPINEGSSEAVNSRNPNCQNGSLSSEQVKDNAEGGSADARYTEAPVPKLIRRTDHSAIIGEHQRNARSPPHRHKRGALQLAGSRGKLPAAP